MTLTVPEAAAPRRPELVSVDGRTYPLKSARLTAHAEGGLAHSRLLQVFANPYDQALEVVYTMPLPAEGAVLGYTVRVGERVIRAVVEPREEAEAAFEKALTEGRSAGLLEQNRDDTFQQRLGNIPPGAKVEVEIELLQPLAPLAATGAIGPQWEYRFPTVVGIRYEGGAGRVPDTGSLDVNRGQAGDIPVRLEIDLTVADPTAKQITSPSHSIVNEPVAGGTRVCFGEGERLDRDLVLRWDACAAEAGVRLLAGGGLPGDDGRYGLVTVTPPAAPRATLNRDLTVLIDASGSMSGEPIAFARQVVKELLVSLESGDRFELLAFANNVLSLTKGMMAATPDTLRHAQAALEALQAGGGTEMTGAIQEALRPLRHDAQRQVVLVTDGHIGFEREVLGSLMKGLPANSRAHAVGIGAAPNRTLTAGVARAGRGVELLANDPVTAREAARRLCAATARPVITDVTIEGAAVLGPASDRLRDVFAGQPLVAAVELRREGGTLKVRGHMAGSTELWVRTIEVPAGEAPATGAVTPLPIGALFGRERIADLELTLAAAHRTEDIDASIEVLGMRHQIASRRTSLVAVAEEPSVEPGAARRTERLAAEVPAGVSAEGIGLLGPVEMGSFMVSPLARKCMGHDLALAQALKRAYGRDPAPAPLFSVGELRHSLERMEHERDALYQAVQERLLGLQAAAGALIESIARERERWTRLESVLQEAVAARRGNAIRRRVDDLFGRLKSHLAMMSHLAEHVARVAWESSANLFDRGPRDGDLRATLDQLERGNLAEYAALVDELNALIAAEFPEVR